MSKKLIITGRVEATLAKDKSRVLLGAGTEQTTVSLPDKTYGLKAADVDRIVALGLGHVTTDEDSEEPIPADPEVTPPES